MDIVKRNLLSIICGVIALAAIIAWMWPLGSIQEEAQQELDARAGLHGTMQSQLTQSRNLPVVDLAGEPKKLETFPTQEVIDWGQKLTKQLSDEAQGVKAVALRLNRHSELVPGSLPYPAPALEFTIRDAFIRYVQNFPKMVKAGTPPNETEITAELENVWRDKYAPQLTIRDGQVDPQSQQQVEAEFRKEEPQVPERLKAQRARSIMFYMAPDALDIPNDITPAAKAANTPLTPGAIWTAHMKLWIQADICNAILEANSKDNPEGNVIGGMVKYVEKMLISDPRGAKPIQENAAAPGMGGMPGGMPGAPMGGMPQGFGAPSQEQIAAMVAAAGGTPAMGPPGMGMGAGTGAPTVGAPLTGRTSNALYDVVPFTIIVHVEADRLPAFLAEIGRNRFMTPYQVNLVSLDSAVLSAQQNVVYGPKPVVRATLECEALMLRDWTVPLMPAPVKQAYGVEGAPAAAGMQ